MGLKIILGYEDSDELDEGIVMGEMEEIGLYSDMMEGL